MLLVLTAITFMLLSACQPSSSQGQTGLRVSTTAPVEASTTPTESSPDAPQVGQAGPSSELASMVTRQDRREDGSFYYPPDWLKAEAISMEKGLQLMTMGST